MATSRGYGIAPLIENPNLNIPIVVEPTGGAYIRELTDKAVHIIQHSNLNPENIHVYFIAGLPDLTIKLKDRRYQYHEVIFPESPEQATQRLIETLHNDEGRIKSLGAKPCFATIAPMSISSWNNHCLDHHKTAHLIHHQQYEDMQDLLIQATIDINHHIIELNINNNMFTPKLGETIVHKQNSHKQHRIRYGRLDKDGVHLTEQTNYMWANIFLESSKRNRSYH